VSLATAPVSPIVGGELVHDLGFALESPWFSESSVSLRDISPRRVIAQSLSRFVLRGAGLDQAKSLAFNDVDVLPKPGP
jgi:hypothetical protein